MGPFCRRATDLGKRAAKETREVRPPSSHMCKHRACSTSSTWRTVRGSLLSLLRLSIAPGVHAEGHVDRDGDRFAVVVNEGADLPRGRTSSLCRIIAAAPPAIWALGACRQPSVEGVRRALPSGLRGVSKAASALWENGVMELAQPVPTADGRSWISAGT